MGEHSANTIFEAKIRLSERILVHIKDILDNVDLFIKESLPHFENSNAINLKYMYNLIYEKCIYIIYNFSKLINSPGIEDPLDVVLTDINELSNKAMKMLNIISQMYDNEMIH